MSHILLFKSETQYIFKALPETQYIWNLFNIRWLQYSNDKQGWTLIFNKTLIHCETIYCNYYFVNYDKMKIVKMMLLPVSFFLFELSTFLYKLTAEIIIHEISTLSFNNSKRYYS